MEELQRKQAPFSTHSATVPFGYRIIGFPVRKLKVSHLGHGKVELMMHPYTLVKQQHPLLKENMGQSRGALQEGLNSTYGGKVSIRHNKTFLYNK